MAEINGGKFGEGMSTAAINKLLIAELQKQGISGTDLRWISAALGITIDGTQCGSIADSATRNNDLEHTVLINVTTFAAAGLVVVMENGRKTLVDETGKAIAWLSEKGEWVCNKASNLWNDFVLWAKKYGKKKPIMHHHGQKGINLDPVKMVKILPKELWMKNMVQEIMIRE